MHCVMHEPSHLTWERTQVYSPLSGYKPPGEVRPMFGDEEEGANQQANDESNIGLRIHRAVVGFMLLFHINS